MAPARDGMPGRSDLAQPVVSDQQMQRIFALVERLGTAPLPLLLLGETGCGKEVIADWVHRCSALADQPFLRINCAGLTESVVESELFGHERGAFTGAHQARVGVFEAANGGTLFLDEVAELPLRTQAKLLRVLETGEILRLGSTRPLRVQVRFVAATHANLLQLIQRGEFRRDLYYRLNGATIEVPPLRQRRADIVPLARFFLQRWAETRACAVPELDESVLASLIEYPWPGNVRELRNVLECAAAMCAGERITSAVLALGRPLHSLEASPALPPAAPAALPPTTRALPPPARYPGEIREQVSAFERDQILIALEHAGGNQTRTARALGISRRTLINKLIRHGILRPRKCAFRQPSTAAGG